MEQKVPRISAPRNGLLLWLLSLHEGVTFTKHIDLEEYLCRQLDHARKILLALRQPPEPRAAEARIWSRPNRRIRHIKGFGVELKLVPFAERNSFLRGNV